MRRRERKPGFDMESGDEGMRRRRRTQQSSILLGEGVRFEGKKGLEGLKIRAERY